MSATDVDGFLRFFLPTSRAGLMMDVVASAMLVVVPGMLLSLVLVRRGRYEQHRKIQSALAAALALTVLVFEVDVRLHGWQARSRPSPYFDGVLFPFLALHITFAVTTAVGWAATFVHATRRLPRPATPAAASGLHRKLGKATMILTIITAVTGWIFYYLAFVAA